MMTSPQIRTVAGTHDRGSFGWRHLLAWNQLSALWKIRVSHHLLHTPTAGSTDEAAWSLALAAEESGAGWLEQLRMTQAPGIVFLDRVSLRCENNRHFRHEIQERYVNGNAWRHVLRLEEDHPLLEGLPKTVPIFGDCPAVTPLTIQPGVTVLVTLNRVPVIGTCGNLLWVGADPWQFGDPSVPMLYKVLSNWLRRTVGYEHPVLQPVAAIRLDDVPTTAEELRQGVHPAKLDRKRAKMVRRLSTFARGASARFTVMYSSHFPDKNGNLQTIRSAMPRSVHAMRTAVQEGAFEIGSHGMVHLRESAAKHHATMDPMEFLDLDEQQTASHLRAAEDEIMKAFETRPESFVAPAWGYRTGVTKRIAARHYPAIADSSQHVERGDCNVLLSSEEEGDGSFNMVETFRSGTRVLSYGDPAFWKCYAGCGIPIHYMQHADTNWQILKRLLRDDERPGGRTGFRWKIIGWMNDLNRPSALRAACAALLISGCCLRPLTWRFVWRALTRSSIYSFVSAMQAAGYRSVTVMEFAALGATYTLDRSASLAEPVCNRPVLGRSETASTLPWA